MGLPVRHKGCPQVALWLGFRPDIKRNTTLLRAHRATQPQLTTEIRDEGLCLYALERYPECAAALREYLAAEPEAGDRSEVESMLRRMQRAAGNDSDGSQDGPPPSAAPPPPG